MYLFSNLEKTISSVRRNASINALCALASSEFFGVTLLPGSQGNTPRLPVLCQRGVTNSD
jgi:hypothetical protein